MNVNYFLKILSTEGYPNPNILSLAKVMGYDLDDFLPDLKEKLGEDGVLDFCKKAIVKLTGEKGLRVDILGSDYDEFVYLYIHPISYDPDESESDIVCKYVYGESKILTTIEDGSEGYSTIQEIIDNVDMGDWSEVDDLIDLIQQKAYYQVFNNCGFGVWWA